MIDRTAASSSSAPAVSLPSPASAKLTGTAWGELPHFCSGLHNVPDTPDILIGLLNDDHTCRARAVWNLYRLLLNQERVFPATAPAALVVAALLDDPRTLAGGQWERRAGRRPLRAELLNWLASFADVARLGAEDGAGAPQDLAAARAARPPLHTHVAPLCEDDDPQVRAAAVAATARLLADPALASSIPRSVPVVREVLARSADSYYRWIARERLETWGEDTTVLITAEEEYRAAVDRAHALAEDPFDESQGQAIRWLAEQPEDTAALDPPGRWHPDWAAPQRAAPHEPAPEPPTAVPASAPGYRGRWQIAGGDVNLTRPLFLRPPPQGSPHRRRRRPGEPGTTSPASPAGGTSHPRGRRQVGQEGCRPLRRPATHRAVTRRVYGCAGVPPLYPAGVSG